MTYCLRRLVSPIAAMVAILAMGMPTARASIEIQLSTDGTTYTTVDIQPSGTTATFSGNFNGFGINVLATDSNSPGSAVAFLEGTDLHVTNNTGGPATLFIRLGDTGFTSPSSGITVNSHVGGTVTIDGPGNTLTFQSYVDQNNGQNSVTGFTPGPQNLLVPTGSFNNDAFLSIPSLNIPYSITEQYAIHLDTGSQLGFQSNTTLTAVPEPSTMAIAGLGALGMIGYGLRRRKALGA